MTKDYKEQKKVVCYHCGYSTKKTYNFTKQKWASKFKCPKCKRGSFQWYNY